MPYNHHPGETNEQRNARLAQEFRDYLDSTPNPTNYSSWLSSMKYEESNSNQSEAL